MPGEHPIRFSERSLSVSLDLTGSPRDWSEQLTEIYSVSLILSALIKAAAAKIGKPHPAEEIK